MRRASGPRVDSSGQPGGWAPPPGTRPSDGLCPESPFTEHGIRIDPPPSDPVASGTRPPATAAAEPPDDPPAERAADHGLTVAPKISFTVSGFQDSSGVLVLATTTPAAPPLLVDQLRVRGGGWRTGVGERAMGRDVSGRVLGVLDREGHAGQRPDVLAAGEALVQRRGLGERGVAVDGDERPQLGVEP